MIIPFADKVPVIGKDVFIAPDAWVIGDVLIHDRASLFFGAVLRGDILSIVIGEGSNIQEHCVLHTSHARTPIVIGREATIGHRATLHGCTIEDRALVGMGSIILDEAVVGEESVVAAGAVVTEGMRIPKRSLVMGVPAKVVRSVTDEEAGFLAFAARHYMDTAQEYIRQLSAHK